MKTETKENFPPGFIRSLYDGIPENKLPKTWFAFYVVYKYGWAKNTFIVGLDTDSQADELQKDLLTHKDIVRCEIFGHYPLELLKENL